MTNMIAFILLGLLAQNKPGAPSEPQKSQSAQERREELAFKLSADGHVELTVGEADKWNGKLTEKTYKADSIEDFMKKYPDVAKRYSIERFASPRTGPDEFAKNFDEWKNRFDERWFWDRDPGEGMEKWLEGLPKSPQSEELEKWLAEQRRLFEKFRGMEAPPGAEFGKAEHPPTGHVLGVLVAPVGKTLASQLGFEKPQGVVIAAVHEGSPAEKAGLQTNDVVVKINGKTISDVAFFRKEVQSSNAPFDLEIIRHGKRQTLKVEPGKHEEKSSD